MIVTAGIDLSVGSVVVFSGVVVAKLMDEIATAGHDGPRLVAAMMAGAAWAASNACSREGEDPGRSSSRSARSGMALGRRC